jgi:hypothetical protein
MDERDKRLRALLERIFATPPERKARTRRLAHEELARRRFSAGTPEEATAPDHGELFRERCRAALRRRRLRRRALVGLAAAACLALVAGGVLRQAGPEPARHATPSGNGAAPRLAAVPSSPFRIETHAAPRFVPIRSGAPAPFVRRSDSRAPVHLAIRRIGDDELLRQSAPGRFLVLVGEPGGYQTAYLLPTGGRAQ